MVGCGAMSMGRKRSLVLQHWCKLLAARSMGRKRVLAVAGSMCCFSLRLESEDET